MDKLCSSLRLNLVFGKDKRQTKTTTDQQNHNQTLGSTGGQDRGRDADTNKADCIKPKTKQLEENNNNPANDSSIENKQHKTKYKTFSSTSSHTLVASVNKLSRLKSDSKVKQGTPIRRRRNTDIAEEHEQPATGARRPRSQPSNGQSQGSGSRRGGLRATRLAIMAQIGEDWLYLALLGIIMALLSFSMDYMINLFLETRLWIFRDLSEDNHFVQYLGWCLTPIILVTFSSAFVSLCSPTAIGSGIPEMKTILRGVVLNEYLTFRTLVAKVVGLTFTLGSGLPLGKEGPFVHMASIVATLLSKLVASFQGIYENESRTSEMLSAACAVGVAATFYAPIGGVLFSIEVTTVYFAVRNYWRGFFAACCGATIWRLLCFWLKSDESISALFKTNFRNDFPFDPIELLVFSFIGASCGLAGAGYIKFHREIVQYFRRHKRLSEFLQKYRFIYPIFVTLIITTVTFPPLIGKYTASTLNTHQTIEHLFSNFTWSSGAQDMTSKLVLDEWSTPQTSFFLHLILYIVMLFWTSALASTIPTPSGIFIPVLKMGAAYGRIIGELMHIAYPEGISYGAQRGPKYIVPGSYAVVGAAAFSGAVTHTISTSMILFELTGQIVHIIPVILGVLISNAVCQSLQPSIYDSIIEIKKLPYLPPIASSNSISHKILVRDFMNTKLAFVWKDKCTYRDVKNLLRSNKKLISFPLVESIASMKLLGSVPRTDLLKLLYLHLGRERRLQEIPRRISDIRAPIIKLDPPPQLSVSPKLDKELNGLRLGLDAKSDKPLIGELSSSSAAESPVTDDEPPGAKQVDSMSYLSVPKQLDVSPNSSLFYLKTENLEAQALESADPDKQADFAVAKPVNHYDRGLGSAGLKSQSINWTLDSPQLSPNAVRPSPVIIDQTQTPGASPLRARPKSILKTSSTVGSFSSIYRPINHDFISQPGTPQEQRFNFGAVSPSLLQKPLSHRNHSSPSVEISIVEHPEAVNRSIDMNGTPISASNRARKVRLPRLRVIDMTLEEQEQWEREQLKSYIDISCCQIDEAPFQLVEQTSLYRVHILFSMLGLNHAYVTSFGRLVGVVALKDIRHAIEKMLQEK